MVFDSGEYLQRINRVHERMAQQAIDTLLIVDPANMNYLAGYDGWSFYAHQGLVVSLYDEMPYWFGREQDKAGAKLTTWLAEDHLFTYPERYVQSFSEHTMQFVASWIISKGWEKGRLGVEFDTYWYSAKSHHILGKLLPEVDLVDADRLVNWIRTYKSESELNYMREAATICGNVIQTAFSSIEAGVEEHAAAAQIAASQIEGAEGVGGGDSPAIFPIMPAGPRTVAGHLSYDPDRVYQEGDIVMLELSGCRRRYHMPLYRTMYVGTPPHTLSRMASVMDEAFDALISFIRPGLEAELVEQQWRKILKPNFSLSPSRVGYSFGLNYVPDWGEHTVNLRPGDSTVLRENMAIHLIACLREGPLVFEASEPILINGNGCSRFMNIPRGLYCP
jgi:Xaa-Pro dipeptidase